MVQVVVVHVIFQHGMLSIQNDKNAAFFGVYDGHGGAKVAEYAGQRLHERIFSQQSLELNATEESNETPRASLNKPGISPLDFLCCLSSRIETDSMMAL